MLDTRAPSLRWSACAVPVACVRERWEGVSCSQACSGGQGQLAEVVGGVRHCAVHQA